MSSIAGWFPAGLHRRTDLLEEAANPVSADEDRHGRRICAIAEGMLCIARHTEDVGGREADSYGFGAFGTMMMCGVRGRPFGGT